MMMSFSPLYNFIKNFKILNIGCFYYFISFYICKIFLFLV